MIIIIKYQSSSLQSYEKEELIEKILNIMQNVEEICSSSFSSDRLSELVGSNNRYVSQVINEKFECNFNALLNRYRINEACRRLSNDDEYACYTTEAISESVGFKSRTTFINSFKKIIGLTPSQYQKIARKDKEETQQLLLHAAQACSDLQNLSDEQVRNILMTLADALEEQTEKVLTIERKKLKN